MQRLMLVAQMLRLEAYLHLHPKYCGAGVDDDAHGDALMTDTMTVLIVDGDDGVVSGR